MDLDTLLARARRGDAVANERLFELLYGELRAVAHRMFRTEPSGQTLDPTGLVHEAFLKLSGSPVPWNDRGHFFAVAANAMHQVLVSHARSRRSRRRRERSGSAPSPLIAEFTDRAVDVIALDEVLREMEDELPRAALIVKLRFFTGLTAKQISKELRVPLRTVQRELEFGRRYLHGRLA